MHETIQRLLSESDSLHKRLMSLAEGLETAAERLRQQGLIPGAELTDELGAARTDLAALTAQVQALADSCGGPYSTHDPGSLGGVRMLLQHVAEAQRQAHARAVARAWLTQVLSLRYNGLEHSPILEAAQQQASTLMAGLERDEIDALTPILEGTHPLVALVQLVGKRDQLSEDAIELLDTQVREGLGPRLAIAALSGRLWLQPTHEYQGVTLVAETIADAGSCEPFVAESALPASEPPAVEAAPPAVEPSAALPSVSGDASTVEPELPAPAAAEPATSPGEATTNLLMMGELATPALATETTDDTPTTSDTALPSTTATPEAGELVAAEVSIAIPDTEEDAELAALLAGLQEAPIETDTLVLRPEPAAAARAEPAAHTELDKIAQDEATVGEEIPEGAAAAIAHTLLANVDIDRAIGINQLIWQLLEEDRPGLAYHLARHLSGQGVIPSAEPALLHAIALSGAVQSDLGDVAALLSNDFASFGPLGESDDDQTTTAVLLRIAATLRAALLAPNTYAYTILQGLPRRHGLEQLHVYCAAITGYSTHLQPLDIADVTRIHDKASWQAELSALQREVRDWRRKAPTRTIKFARASQVWLHWQQPGGLIDRLLQIVQEDNHGQLDQLQREVQRLATGEAIRREVHQTDSKELGLSQRGAEPIVGAALNQIRLYSEQALELARRWIELQRRRPDSQQGFLMEQAEQLRSGVIAIQRDVLLELEHGAARATSQPGLAAAFACCRRAIDQIGVLVSTTRRLTNAEIPPTYLLGLDLLRTTKLSIDSAWEPVGPPEATEAGLLDAVRRLEAPWPRILGEWADQQNFEQTQRIVAALESLGHPADELAQLQHDHERRLATSREELGEDLATTQGAIEGAVAYGVLRETDRLALVAEIQTIEHAGPAMLQFTPAHERLARIRAELAEDRQQRVETTRERLVSDAIGGDHPAYARIVDLLDQGDYITANDYIDKVVAGQPLPDPEPEGDLLKTFFPEVVWRLTQFLENEAPTRYIERLIGEIREYARGSRTQRTFKIAGFEQQRVAGPQAMEAADLIERWFKAKDVRDARQPFEPLLIRGIFEALGFRVRKCSPAGGGKLVRFDLETEPLQDQSLCPIARYGSLAKGHYAVFCSRERPTERDILQEIEPFAQSSTPPIVLYFSRMTEPRRREFAQLSLDPRRTCLLIDDLLVLYLATLRPPRLPHLFDLAMPFTYVDPYSTTAGVVPTEIFYGRSRERDAIINPMGSCFIYGGRQLGKTALLRDVERTYHNPARGMVVSWIDLKAEGVGNDRPIEAIWQLIARELRRHGVLSGSVPNHINEDRLLEHLFEWLYADQKRRILLLLDEADRFLDSDGRATADGRDAFRHASKLKGLMDRTERRFKVVFAGLHNVKRTTRQSNNPLAHYGEPICIGPLLDNGEWREARALIQRPLASAGYRFESPDLITRILSQTNYYPSLIQLYCKQLLDHVSQPQALHSDPPYTIATHHIEEVYRSEKLRNDIRHRFDLTIQLDLRYEVIAYVVAFASVMDEGRGMVEGFHLDEIRSQALASWPAGFRESDTEDLFHALLDEMTGLGILREVRTKHYALRSPNVVLLMGTDEEILRKLDREREPPVSYEPGTFRAAFRDEERAGLVRHERRSPLTAQQLSELQSYTNGVSLIYGTLAAGRDELSPFLQQTFGKEHFHELSFMIDRSAFRRELEKVLRQRPDKGTTLILVPAICTWSAAWVADTLDALDRLRSQSAWARVVFVAEPTNLWQLLEPDQTGEETIALERVSQITLRPWHDHALRQWLDDCGFSVTDSLVRQRIHQSTGSWPRLLSWFYNQVRGDPRYWHRAIEHLDQQLAHGELHDDLVKQFEFHHSPGQRRLLEMAADLTSAEGVVSYKDLCEMLEEMEPEQIQRCLRWAELLSLVRPAGSGIWQLDPVVRRLLTSTTR